MSLISWLSLISTGVLCSCFEGFRLTDDNKTCQDINECEDPSSCSQHCFNNRGSFWCKCVEGYKLESDVTRCKAAGKRKSRENRRLYYLVPALPVPEVWDSTSKNTHSIWLIFARENSKLPKNQLGSYELNGVSFIFMELFSG